MKYRLIFIATLVLLFAALMSLAPLSSAQEFGSNWTAQYYNNTSFSGSPDITTIDQAINFTWGTSSPIPGFINADNFSVRWTGTHTFSDGVYTFTAGRDDAIRVFVDGVMVIDAFGTGPYQTFTANVTLTAGSHTVVVEYVEYTGDAAVLVQWQLSGGTTPDATAGPTATPTATALPPIPAGAITATVIRAAVLNVRDAPSTGGNVLDRVFRGQTYQVVGRNEDATWFLIQMADKQGWVWYYYVFINGNEFTPPVVSANTTILPAGLTDTGVLAQSHATVRLREFPTVNSRQIGRVSWGGFVPVLARSSNGVWWQVLWKNTVGWVYSPFFDIVQGDYFDIPIVDVTP